MPRSPSRRDRDRDRDRDEDRYQPRRRDERFERDRRPHDRDRDRRDRHYESRPNDRYNARERSPRGDSYRRDRRDRTRSRDRHDNREKRRGDRDETEDRDQREVKKPRRDIAEERPHRDEKKSEEKPEKNGAAPQTEADVKAEAERRRKYAENLARIKQRVSEAEGKPTASVTIAKGNGKEASASGSGSSPNPLADTNAKPSSNIDTLEAKFQKKPKVLGGDFKPTPAMKSMPSQNTNNAPSHQAVNPNGKFAGIKLNRSKPTSTKPGPPVPARKGPAGFGEEEVVERKKFVPLPEMTAEDQMDIQDDGDDESDVIQDDDEEAAGHLAAADRRARAAMAAVQESATPANGVVRVGGEKKAAQANGNADEEEVDPLDAYMVGIEREVRNAPKLPASAMRHVPRVYHNDDNEVTIDAVGDQFDDIDSHRKKGSKKKDLPPVDHANMDYAPFRKNFYTESSELSELTEDEVQLARMNEGVKVKGNNPPKPINKWSQGGFSTQILDILRDRKYEKPTPIQREALPAILSGRDMVGVAQTGSGKTVAFILPMFRHVKDQPPIENGDGPIAVILAPTRELASQIHKECKPYLTAYSLRAVAAYGGSDLKTNIAEMKRGTEIVVATPGRFIELLTANNGRVTNLHRVTYLVLDEADRMFDMGFEPQIMKIMNNIRPNRQTVLFSATLPMSILGLAKKKLTDALEVTVGSRSVVAADITQSIEVREEDTRFARLLQILGETYHDESVKDRTLVFVERQEAADALFGDLLKRQYSAVTIHGGREQIDREDSIRDFKNGKVSIMIATSVAARGLDVQELKLVINYDPPNHLEDYVHRVGRTGRAGNKGNAITFVSENQCKTAPFLIKALKDSKHDIPEPLKKLNELFEEKVKEGKERKLNNSRQGFAGRGTERFAAQREQERAREGKAFDNDGEAVEEDEGKDKDKKPESKHQEAVDQAMAKAMGGSNVTKAGEGEAQANSDDDPAKRQGPVEIAANLQNKLNDALIVEKRATEAEPDVSQMTGLERAMRARQKANQQLGATGSVSPPPDDVLGTNSIEAAARPGASIDNRGPDAGEYHARLEINDFPQKARWSVTNRSNVGRILESTGVSITNKGTYFAPGVEPGDGDAKLYILVEGDTEMAVENAMRQLTEKLREGYIAAMEDDSSKASAPGRYSVV
ncbi:hypothetical protein MBLNU230_g1205t1 [Neophaeotheca triangularis]